MSRLAGDIFKALNDYAANPPMPTADDYRDGMCVRDERDMTAIIEQHVAAMEAENAALRDQEKFQAELYQAAIRKLSTARELLTRVTANDNMEPPDAEWFRDYYLLTGEHMVMTEDGWMSGKDRGVLDEDDIMDEINAPTEAEAALSGKPATAERAAK